MFRRCDWIEAQLRRVLDEHQASVGYSTCLWHNVRSARPLFDRGQWFAALQAKARSPYPGAPVDVQRLLAAAAAAGDGRGAVACVDRLVDALDTLLRDSGR